MFKKMFVLLVLAVVAAGVIAGCGQQTPTINTSMPRPEGLSIRGTVFYNNIDGSRGPALAGASVALSGSSGTFFTTTDSKGEYTISGIPDGSYNIVVTAEGYERNSSNALSIKPEYNVPANGTISVKDIILDSKPVILSYSPVPNTVISANQAFTVTFNEVIDRSSFKPTLTALGIRTMVTNGNNVGITVSSTDNKTLVITPTQTLSSNESYRLTINSGATGVRDLAGFILSTSGEQAMNNSQDFRVGTGTGLPGDPSNLAIVYNTTTECDYTRVYNNAGTLYLSWTSPTTGGPVSGYNVYVAYGSSNNYVLVNSTPIVSNQYTLTTDGSGNDVIYKLYGSGAVRDPVCTGGYPFINDKLRVKVVAVNGDGESATGVAIEARDTLGPTLNGNNDSTFAAAAKFVNNVLLPKLAAGEAYISFTEPIASVGSASLYHIGTYEATSVQLITTSSAAESVINHLTGARSIVKVIVPGPIAR